MVTLLDATSIRDSNALKTAVTNTANTANAAVPANNTYADGLFQFLQAAILSGAYSTPNIATTPAGLAATAAITDAGTASALITAALVSTCSAAGAGFAAGAPANAVITLVQNVVAGLIIARDTSRLRAADKAAITLIIDNLVGAGGAAGQGSRATLEASATAAVGTPVAILARLNADIIAGLAAGTPLQLFNAAIGAGGPNALIVNLLIPLARIGVMTAALNRLGNNNTMARYSLDRNTRTDNKTLASLMHGDETLLMGRPRFISDQLFHKVLPTLDANDKHTYYENGSVIPVDAVAGNGRQIFEARFNTRIVRNLMHCTNVQRVLRLRLNQELTSYRDVFVNSESITNPSLTEFGNLRWTDMRLGPGTINRTMDPRNEDARSRTYNSEDTVGIPR